MKRNDNSKFTIENFPKFRLKFFFQVSLITLSITISMAFLGFLLDSYLKTKPLFLILFLVVSFPITQYLLYKYVKKL